MTIVRCLSSVGFTAKAAPRWGHIEASVNHVGGIGDLVNGCHRARSRLIVIRGNDWIKWRSNVVFRSEAEPVHQQKLSWAKQGN
jgi:hypothetical protein